MPLSLNYYPSVNFFMDKVYVGMCIKLFKSSDWKILFIKSSVFKCKALRLELLVDRFIQKCIVQKF